MCAFFTVFSYSDVCIMLCSARQPGARVLVHISSSTCDLTCYYYFFELLVNAVKFLVVILIEEKIHQNRINKVKVV